MAIYQQGEQPPKTKEEQRIKGIRFSSEYFDNVLMPDGFVEVRPKANLNVSEVKDGTLYTKVIGDIIVGEDYDVTIDDTGINQHQETDS